MVLSDLENGWGACIGGSVTAGWWGWLWGEVFLVVTGHTGWS